MRAAPQRERFNHAKLRRGSRGRFGNCTSFRRSTSPNSAEGRAGDLKIAKNHEFSKVDQPKLRRGSRGRKNHEFSKVDQPKVRRGSRGRSKNHEFSKVDQPKVRRGSRVFEGRPAQSPQRVAGILKIAKNHEFLKVGGPKPRQGHEKPLAK